MQSKWPIRNLTLDMNLPYRTYIAHKNKIPSDVKMIHLQITWATHIQYLFHTLSNSLQLYVNLLLSWLPWLVDRWDLILVQFLVLPPLVLKLLRFLPKRFKLAIIKIKPSYISITNRVKIISFILRAPEMTLLMALVWLKIETFHKCAQAKQN